MSVVEAPPAVEPEAPAAPPPARPPRWRSPRLAASLGLLAVFVSACLVYGYQAWQHEVPWLFQDEIFYASQAREYADTGELTIRGEPHGEDRLTPIVTSIAWRFDDPEHDYLAAKLLNVLLMAAACFPAYLLARLVVGRAAAIFAAAGTVAIPAFVYASMILTEPLGYLLSTTSLYLIARTLAFDRLRLPVLLWGVGACAACYAAAQTRGQLQLLAVAFGLAAAFRLLLSAPARRRRLLAVAGWIALGVTAYVVYHRREYDDDYLYLVRHEWELVWRGATWGFGALAIGIFVVPAVLGLAALWPTGNRRRLPGHVAFSLVAVTTIALMVWYTGVKTAYLDLTFATRVIERNLIYIAPLLFVGTAIFLQYRRLNPVALGASLAFVAYAVYSVPYQLEFRIYSDAPGLAILSTANRHLRWTDGSVEKYLAVMLGVALVVSLVFRFVSNRTAVRVGAVALGIAMVAGTLAGEIAGSRSSNGSSAMFAANLPKPFDWVWEATGGERTILIGTAIADPNGIWLTQFFNPNAYYFATLDSVAPPPGPNSTLDVVGDDGLVAQQFPDAPYAVVDNKARIVGDVIRKTEHQTLYRVDQPLRIASASYGVMSDGWMSSHARYFQFSSPQKGPGVIEVTISRAAWGGEDVPGFTLVSVSPLHWEGPHDYMKGRLVTDPPIAVEAELIHSRQIVRYWIPTDGPPFVVNVSVAPTFSPADFGGGDGRQLGVQPTFRYLPDFSLDRVVKRELNPPARPEELG